MSKTNHGCSTSAFWADKLCAIRHLMLTNPKGTVKNPEQWGNPANDQAPPDVYIEADNSAIICFQRSGHSDTFSEPSKDQGDAAAAGRHVHEGWKEPQQHANPANIAGNTDAQQSYGGFAVPDAEKEMQAFQR